MGVSRVVARLIYRRQRGRGGVEVEYLGPLALAAASLYDPPGLSPRRLARRAARLERTLARMGVGRVVFPQGFPHGGLFPRLRPVDPLTVYRGAAEVLALAGLERLEVEPRQGRAALAGTWLCPELRQAAWRLAPQVRGLLSRVPGEEGGALARQLHREYGLPAAPPSGGADMELAFSPGGAGESRLSLALYGAQPRLAGLALRARGMELPERWADGLLSLLWEQGAVRREELYAVSDGISCPTPPAPPVSHSHHRHKTP